MCNINMCGEGGGGDTRQGQIEGVDVKGADKKDNQTTCSQQPELYLVMEHG